MTTLQVHELHQIDEFLEGLDNESSPQCDLLREHLESARTYLAGSMPIEYALSLKMADESLGAVSNVHLRESIKNFIRESERR